jgi:hypothetical protein
MQYESIAKKNVSRLTKSEQAVSKTLQIRSLLIKLDALSPTSHRRTYVLKQGSLVLKKNHVHWTWFYFIPTTIQAI